MHYTNPKHTTHNTQNNKKSSARKSVIAMCCKAGASKTEDKEQNSKGLEKGSEDQSRTSLKCKHGLSTIEHNAVHNLCWRSQHWGLYNLREIIQELQLKERIDSVKLLIDHPQHSASACASLLRVARNDLPSFSWESSILFRYSRLEKPFLAFSQNLAD